MRHFVFRSVHRLTGLCVGIPLLLFVVTGLPLQMSDQLDLGRTGVPFGWVHSAYGIEIPRQASSVQGVTQLGDVLLSEQRQIAVAGDLLGSLILDEFLLVATTAELLLWPLDSEAPVERVALPDVAHAFTADAEQIRIAIGSDVLSSRDLGASWVPSADTAIDWQQPVLRSATTREQRRFGAALVSWERWLQDLHSGRFFGTVGVFVMYLASVALVLLSITGFVVWFSSRSRGR